MLVRIAFRRCRKTNPPGRCEKTFGYNSSIPLPPCSRRDNDAFFPEVGIATLELLERFGHEVVYPRDQTCCGQPMADTGFNTEAAATEALFVRDFSGFDWRGGARG
jgi:hypothetical protein